MNQFPLMFKRISVSGSTIGGIKVKPLPPCPTIQNIPHLPFIPFLTNPVEHPRMHRFLLQTLSVPWHPDRDRRQDRRSLRGTHTKQQRRNQVCHRYRLKFTQMNWLNYYKTNWQYWRVWERLLMKDYCIIFGVIFGILYKFIVIEINTNLII